MTKGISRRVCIILFGCLACVGCTGSSGPQRYDVKGSVTFQEKAIPKGEIVFEPEDAKVARGVTEIVDGKYSLSGKNGLVPGDYTVFIIGFDGSTIATESDETPRGLPLFPTFKTKVQIPNKSAKRDFDIPPPSNTGLHSKQ